MKLMQLEQVESKLKHESYDLSKFLYNFIPILYSEINFHIYFIIPGSMWYAVLIIMTAGLVL
jgi:hypothetical protein